jgi:Uncharacterised protein family UPF0047
METLLVKTERRTQLVDVTERVQRAVAQAGVASGVCHIYVPHTTRGCSSMSTRTRTWRGTWRRRSIDWFRAAVLIGTAKGIPIRT